MTKREITIALKVPRDIKIAVLMEDIKDLLIRQGCETEIRIKQPTEQRDEAIQRRIIEMYGNDQVTGEHKDATPRDYFDWAVEEVDTNNLKK